MKRVLGGAGSLWGGLQRTLNTVVMRLNVVICEIEGLRGFHLGIGMARFLHTHTRTHACTLTPHTFIMHVHTITHTPHINHTGEHTDTATCTHLNVYVNTHVLL